MSTQEQKLSAVPPAAGAAPAAPAAPAAASQPPNRRVLVIAAIVALVAIGVGGRMWYRSHYYVETDNAYVAGHVTPVSSRISGVVTKLLIEDNQLVKEGDVIAELDPFDQGVRVEQIQAQIASAKQQVVQADAQIVQVQAQASAAAAQVAQSQAQLVRANQDAERFGQLYNSQMKAVSKSELDAAVAARASAVADVAARKDSTAAAKAQIESAKSARDVAQAQVAVLQVQLKDAQQQLAYNKILAPVTGRIGKRTIEVGQRVQPGQQLTAIVQENVWLTANFKETQLAELKPGQEVKVSVDALPGRELIGKVDSFSPASGAQFALLPADNATGNFTKIVQRVPVKVTFKPEDVKALSGRLVPGMSAIAEVSLKSDNAAR
ncbi:HlyD family efflux transporter periplasmic adaptor subunit [Pseudoduganella sp. FT25W]|jgi:membrane fusion protein (multidrug efflux system)|uniref:HlyD family efflux transporter periplasmic adaptor subunit n=1 Tax=Duganella alba TaxID=2666081 RepID=A0A6L5QBQ0_9BURK|nr:HlyD family secretion protein [Duganella alba]MRX07204.1 HlyD family efflux transporter periplasmic adaptor subunit [Duganella alba]MRX15101.1 HlyD family efflux transporter periplasmic adaptor subunit [Duganella alba]